MDPYYEKLINIHRQLLQIWEHCKKKLTIFTSICKKYSYKIYVLTYIKYVPVFYLFHFISYLKL